MSGVRASDTVDGLVRFSAEIGRDATMVQAAGGNTSVKDGERLWVKASGTWLAEAAERPIMVAVDLAACRDAVLGGDPADPSTYLVDTASGLRPSVETAMHAVMPHRYVAHVHCVDTIAWAVQGNAATLLRPKLDGFAWRFIPYVTPGVPLARAIATTTADVLVLGNHGLVVGAASIEDLSARLNAVRQRLRRAVEPSLPWPSGMGDFAGVLADTGFRPATDAETHELAFLPQHAAIAERGTLYPDHAVFLGPALPVAADRARCLAIANDTPEAKAVLVPGLGIGVREDALRGADAMARCLTDVVTRLRADDDLVYVDDAELAALLDWDAEKYRQSLNRDETAL